MGPQTTHADTAVWYKKYEGELRRLEALHGGWSKDLGDQARAFADGVPYVPYRSPEEDAADPAPATVSSVSPKNEETEAAFDWDKAFGRPDTATVTPASGSTESIWDDILPAKARDHDEPVIAPAQASADPEDAVDWDQAFGRNRHQDTKSASKPAGDFDWDEAFGRPQTR